MAFGAPMTPCIMSYFEEEMRKRGFRVAHPESFRFKEKADVDLYLNRLEQVLIRRYGPQRENWVR